MEKQKVRIIKKTPTTSASVSSSKTALSLFSGAGGDTCGLEQAGWDVKFFSEISTPAILTHQTKFPHSSLLKTGNSTDIKQLPDSTFESMRGKVNLIFAGHPCQGFSHAGKKRSDDPRNELVHEFVRAAKIIQPEWIVGENVRGLLSRKGVYPENTPPRPVIYIIRDLFESIGYKLTWRVFDANEVKVPQCRKRLIYVGHRGTEYPHLPWERVINKEPLKIRPLLETHLVGAVELPDIYKPAKQDARFWIETTDEPSGTPHPNLVRLVSGIRNLSSKEKEQQGIPKDQQAQFTEPEGLISFGVRKGCYHGQILDPDGPSKTIICAYTQCPRLFVGLYNKAISKYYARCLSINECSRIQGFPEDYPWAGSDKDKITQIGNAVPPPLAQTIANLLQMSTFHSVPQDAPTPTAESDDEDQ
jgi:DNA (cytosine-5)-methyltransferase 1